MSIGDKIIYIVIAFVGCASLGAFLSLLAFHASNDLTTKRSAETALFLIGTATIAILAIVVYAILKQ